MIIYFMLLFVVVLAINYGRGTKGKLTRWMYFIACSAMVLVAGVRSRHVGTDASYYVEMFNRTSRLDDVVSTPLEPGYFILCWLAHAVSDNYLSIFTLVALVTTVCFAWVIHRYSVDQTVSFFVLLVGGYYSVAFNGFRQGLANAVFCLAIGAVFRKNFILYASCVAAAMVFHKSAIIALPLYFLIIRKNDLNLNLFIMGLGIFSVYFFGLFVNLGETIDPRYAQYGEAVDEGRGLVSLAFIVALCSFFFCFKAKVCKYREMYDPLLNMFLLAATITVVSAAHATGASGVRRLAMYFSLSAILLWPIVYANIINKRARMLFLYCFTAGYLLYYGLTLQSFGQMVPYTFNPVVLEWWAKFL